MRRILILLGLAIGVLLGAFTVNAFQTITVTGTTTNPACLSPPGNIACALGLVPTTVTGTTSITGLGLIAVQGVLLGLAIAAVVGLFVLLAVRRAAARDWALFTLILALAFLATFAAGYALLVAIQYQGFINLCRVLGWDCLQFNYVQTVVAWVLGAVVAALFLVAVLRYTWRSPGGAADA